MILEMFGTWPMAPNMAHAVFQIVGSAAPNNEANNKGPGYVLTCRVCAFCLWGCTLRFEALHYGALSTPHNSSFGYVVVPLWRDDKLTTQPFAAPIVAREVQYLRTQATSNMTHCPAFQSDPRHVT